MLSFEPSNHSVEIHNFSITQISRAIYFWDSYSEKSAILTHLEALKFDFYEIWHFLKADIYQILTKFIVPKIAKTAAFALIESPKLILHNI